MDMTSRDAKEVLPRPSRIHHILEDFLTTWDAPQNHVTPLRRFFEAVTDYDLRHFYAEDCVGLMLTNRQLPLTCLSDYVPVEHELKLNEYQQARVGSLELSDYF